MKFSIQIWSGEYVGTFSCLIAETIGVDPAYIFRYTEIFNSNFAQGRLRIVLELYNENAR